MCLNSGATEGFKVISCTASSESEIQPSGKLSLCHAAWEKYKSDFLCTALGCTNELYCLGKIKKTVESWYTDCLTFWPFSLQLSISTVMNWFMLSGSDPDILNQFTKSRYNLLIYALLLKKSKPTFIPFWALKSLAKYVLLSANM